VRNPSGRAYRFKKHEPGPILQLRPATRLAIHHIEWRRCLPRRTKPGMCQGTCANKGHVGGDDWKAPRPTGPFSNRMPKPKLHTLLRRPAAGPVTAVRQWRTGATGTARVDERSGGPWSRYRKSMDASRSSPAEVGRPAALSITRGQHARWIPQLVPGGVGYFPGILAQDSAESFLAFVYQQCRIPLAAVGLLTPMLQAQIMAIEQVSA